MGQALDRKKFPNKATIEAGFRREISTDNL